MSPEPAPFIPPSSEEHSIPPAPWRLFGTRPFFKLWLAQVFSSLGDWVGFFAILAADRPGLERLRGRVQPRDRGAHGPGLLPRHARRRDRRPVRPAQGDGLLRPRPRRADLRRCRSSTASRCSCSSRSSSRSSRCCGARRRTRRCRTSCPRRTSRPRTRSRSSRPTARSRSPALITARARGRRGLARRLRRAALAQGQRRDPGALVRRASPTSSRRSSCSGSRSRAGRSAADQKFEWTSTFSEIKDGLSFIRTDRFARAVIVGLGGGVIGAGAMVPLSHGVRRPRCSGASPSSACCCSRSAPAPRSACSACSRSRSGCRATRSSSGRSSAPGSASRLGRGVQRRRPRRGDDRGRRRVRRRGVRHRLHACSRRRSPTSCGAARSPRCTRWCGSACCCR